MTYSNSSGNRGALFKRTLLQVSHLSGRSRRREVIYYWLAAFLAALLLSLTATAITPFESRSLVHQTVMVVILIPFFALFVRRLHDQNRSGWWAALLPLSLLLSIPRMLADLRGDIPALIAAQKSPLGMAAALVGVAVMVLCLLPGTDGPNHYGPDPRLA